MKNIVKNKILYLILLFLVQCGNEIPAWYKNPSINKDFFYAIGFSNINYEDAKRKALSDLISQIKINITGKTYSSVNKGSNDLVTKTFNQSFSSQIDNLEINNYEIEKQTQTKEGFYILISLNKEQFISFLKRDIESKIFEIKDTLQSFENKNLSNFFFEISPLKKRLEELSSKEYIFRVLNKNYDQSYQKEILMISKNLKKIEESLVYYIEADNIKIEEIFKNIFLKKGYKITNNKTKEKNLINVKIGTNFEENKVFESFNVKAVLNCKMLNNEENFLNFEITDNSNSVSNYESAKNNLFNKMKISIEENLDSLVFKN